MKKVWITPGCISCGACEFLCPQVFEVKVTSQINSTADLSSNSDSIKNAASACPVNVIKYEE